MLQRFFFLFCLGVTLIKVEASETFLSQQYIDSLVDNTLMQFTNLSDPSNEKSIESIIQEAKNTVSRLRLIAENDQNKNYILSKLTELENHIYLEEHDLTIEKAQWKQKISNQIISDFNTEIGKTRPDFNQINSLHTRLQQIDQVKCKEMSCSIKNRASYLLQAIPNDINTAIGQSKYDIAYEDLAYCRNNSLYIGFTLSELAQLEAKLIARSSLEQSIQFVRTGIDSIKFYLGKMNFREARRIEILVKYQIDFIKKDMISIEWNRYSQNLQLINKKINNKEDSCISIASKLLNAGKISEAGDYIDSLSKAGLSPEKISYVNKELLSKIIFQQETTTHTSIYTFAADTSDQNPVFNDLLLEAKNRALAKRDSISKRRDENNRFTQVAEIRRDRLQITKEMQQKRSDSKKTNEINRAYEELVLIYKYFEEKDLDRAKNHYDKVKKLLDTNLSDQDLSSLKAKLNTISSYDSESQK